MFPAEQTHEGAVSMGFGVRLGTLAMRGRALVAIGAAVALLPFLLETANATCTITGSGTQTTLQSGDTATCTGAGNTPVVTNNGGSNVTVNVGDGTTVTTLNGGASAGVGFDTTSNSTITIFNQAAITSDNTGILIFGGSNNILNVNAGATISTTTLGSAGISLDGSSSDNTINIGGTVGDLTAGTRGVDILGGTGNTVNILSGGIVQSGGSNAINLSGAGFGNIITNQGTISSTTNTAIFGSTNQDVIVNIGTITTGGTTAVDLGGGADVFQLRAGSSITGRVLGGTGTDTLSLGGLTDSSFDLSTFGAAAQFREFEAMTKNGTSTWTLTGTTMDAVDVAVINGALIVNGSMVNATATSHSGGIVGGSGTVGSLWVQTGGVVAPGSGGIGTFNVNGAFQASGDATYAVDVNAAGQSDLIDVGGTAALSAGTVAITTLPGAFATTTQYTILTAAGGITGTFSGTTISGYNPLFFSAAVTYDAFNVFLTLNYNDTAFLDIAETPNQKAVAEAMGTLGAAAPFVAQFVGLTDDEIRLGLDTLSGEVHASLKGVIGAGPSLFASTVRNRLANAFDSNGRDRLAEAAKSGPAYRLGAVEIAASGDEAILPVSPFMWLSGAGATGDIDSDGNAAAVSSNSRGIFGGIDVPVDTNMRLGFAAGWSRTNANVDERASTADADAWHVAGTGAAAFGKLRIRGALAYADYDIDTTRTAIIGSDTYTATAGYGGHRVEGLLEAGYVMNAYGATFEPYAGAGFSWLRVGSFTETGGGDANLTADSSTENAPFSVLGLRYTSNWTAGGMALKPSLDIAWRHLFDGADPTRTLAFASAATTPWSVAGAPVGSNAAVVSAGLEALLTQSLSASARYQGDFSGEAEMHAFEGGLMLKF